MRANHIDTIITGTVISRLAITIAYDFNIQWKIGTLFIFYLGPKGGFISVQADYAVFLEKHQSLTDGGPVGYLFKGFVVEKKWIFVIRCGVCCHGAVLSVLKPMGDFRFEACRIFPLVLVPRAMNAANDKAVSYTIGECKYLDM
jgi:hypothetical protein